MKPVNANHTLLVIDDDVDLRRLVALSLRLSGYEVLVAQNGLEGMEITKQRTPDLILVDLMMPGMDGLRFLGWLRQEAKAQMPVITMTAADDEDTLRAALSAGATRVVKKPVQFDSLEEILEELLAVPAGV